MKASVGLHVLATILLLAAVQSHPKTFKNRHNFLKKEILSQEEIEGTIRRIENGDHEETAELVDIEEKQEADRRVLTVKSSKREMKLDLTPAYGLIRPDIRVVVMDNDGETETDLPASLRFGLYRGSVTGSHTGVAALVKNDEGWHGSVSTEDRHFHIHGLKSSSRSLLVHLPTASEGDAFETDYLEMTEEKEPNNLSSDEIFTRALGPELKLELGITTDADVYKSVQKKFPDTNPETKIKEMIVNTVNGIQAYFTASNLDYKINFEIAAIHILKDLPKEIKKQGGTFFAYKYFCEWDATINNPGLVNYDMGLFFTAHDENGAGVAPVGTTCRGKSSCALGQLTSYSGAVIMTHEIGHNLDGPHDTENKDPATDCGKGYILWPVVNKGANNFSSCSNKRISKYIKWLDDKGKNCMRTDSKSSLKVCPTTLLPGRTLHPNEQCHLIYGDGYSDSVTSKDYCAVLGCRKYFVWYYPYIGPPLPGSECGSPGETKMCWQDECLEHSVVYDKIKKLYEGRKPGPSSCPLPDINPPEEVPNPCGPGWQKNQNFCYQRLRKEGTRDEGERACKALGGGSNLVSITSKQEADFVYRYGGEVLIGLKDVSGTTEEGTDVKRQWQWADGRPFVFTSWASGQPNNWRGSEKCVRLNWGFAWYDVPCDEKLQPLCKKPLVAPPEYTTTPAPEKSCGKDWKKFKNSCYQLIPKPGTGMEGEAACKELGGGSELASILDKEETEFIGTTFTFPSRFFIGLRDKSSTTKRGKGVKREWYWTDGSAFNYKAWDSPEPNNWDGSEDPAKGV